MASASTGSMIDIPREPAKIRARIRRYERALQAEKRRHGSYSDAAGKRYFLGPLYLLAGDLDGALKSFAWFERTFPDDAGDGGQALCWALALRRNGDEEAAATKLRFAMLEQGYLVAQPLCRDLMPLLVSADDDALQRMYLGDVPGAYLSAWTAEEIAWARSLYDGEAFTRQRARHVEIQRRLVGMQRGTKRTALVREMFAMKYGPKP